MNKIIYAVCFFSLSFIVNAKGEDHLSYKEQLAEIKKIGIPASFKEDFNRSKTERELKGFNETDNDYARYLLKLKHNAPSELKSFNSSIDSEDTHLKVKPTNIQLTFPFKGIAGIIKDENIIGYAPIGSYINSSGSWTGIKAFFSDPDLGTCAYAFVDLKPSGGEVISFPIDKQYFVNNKISSKYIEGSKPSGFVYTVSWYTQYTDSTLDCANMKFDKEILTKMIVLAKQIDAR